MDGDDVVLDLEAGLEHFSRGTPRHVDLLVTVIEPYHRSLEAGRRIADLARDLGVGDVAAVVNKVRSSEDREVVERFCERHGLTVAAWIPFDDALLAAERAGRAPLDHDEDAPAVSRIRSLAQELLRHGNGDAGSSRGTAPGG